VHVADLAALAAPESPLDLEARARGESLHLPEGTLHMVPREVTMRLGLGLQERSPALSFGIDLATDASPRAFTMMPSWVRVTRMTYTAAEARMDEEPFATLDRLLTAARARRAAHGAVLLDFPEVAISVVEGRVILRPLPPLRSREMVAEAMIQAGIETARFAAGQGLPLAFSQQQSVLEQPAGEVRADTTAIEPTAQPQTLSAMFALRRLLKRSRYHAAPGPHSGLGAPAYAQVTSPLRRSLDLVNHQQLRAFLRGAPWLEESAVVERIGALEAVLGGLRPAEYLSEKHWTLVYLLQNPGWRGEGILVERRGVTGLVLVPSLALEARVHLRRELPLDHVLSVEVTGVDLPQRDVSLRVVNER
jgi:exoribonuclease-2